MTLGNIQLMDKVKKVAISIVFVLGILSPNLSQAETGRNFGLGLYLGDPTGFTANFWVKKWRSVQVLMGWTNGKIHVAGDYLWYSPNIFKVERAPFHLSYGLGARIVDRDSPGTTEIIMGVRAPLGIHYIFANAPIELGLQIAFVVDFISDPGLDIDGGLIVRYYF